MPLALRCPLCRHGRLMYPIDQARGRCMACYLRTCGLIRPALIPTPSFRSEADAYGEGIWDDD